MLSLDIQFEIIKRIPIKSVIQFRSVCKAWKSFIDSPDFINGYTTQSEYLVIKYENGYWWDKSLEISYVSYVDDDDDTFPQQKVALNIPSQLTTQLTSIIGSSHGLLCLANNSFGTKMAVVVWNPAIRKSITIVVPNNNVVDHQFSYVVGFGVCPDTKDPMLVKITYIDRYDDKKIESISCIPSQVMVFTLSSGEWRTCLCRNLPRNSIEFTSSHIVMGRFIHWLADDRIDCGRPVIMSFDMSTQEFSQIDLPNYDELVDLRGIDPPNNNVNFLMEPDFLVARLKDSFVVVENIILLGVCVVWMIENGDSTSFTKLFTIQVPNASFLRTLGFSKSGKPIVEINYANEDDDDDNPPCALVYEPCSEHIKDLGIRGDKYFSSVNSYTESLLLLNHVDGRIIQGERM